MGHEKRKLKVCIDARIADGEPGGLQQVVIGLASRLSKFTGCEEEYSFLCYRGGNDWLKPFVSGPCKFLYAPELVEERKGGNLINVFSKRFPTMKKRFKKMLEIAGLNTVQLKTSDGTIETANIDIMHFNMQDAFLTEIPSIYQPHDLQHLHFPEFFSRGIRKSREKRYRLFCERAQIVVAMTEWGRSDIVQRYGLDRNKVKIVPWAPILSEYKVPSKEALSQVRRKYEGFDEFIFYPAQTWKHKNHMGLIKALSILRQKFGKIPKLICSGMMNEFYDRIWREIQCRRLQDQIKFTGFVSPDELQCLYRLCKFLVFPSKFEGWGLPITEAFYIGVPVACSNVTSLPSLVGDAAIMFDPDSPDEIAAAIWRLNSDESLRQSLIDRGRKRAELFSWSRTAKLFRAHYRNLAHAKLTSEDRELLCEEAYI